MQEHFYHFYLWASPPAPSPAMTVMLNCKLDQTSAEMTLQSFNIWQPQMKNQDSSSVLQQTRSFHSCFSLSFQGGLKAATGHCWCAELTTTAATAEPQVLYSPQEKANGRTCRLPSCHKNCLISAGLSAARWKTSACMVSQQPRWSNPLGRLQSQMGRLQTQTGEEPSPYTVFMVRKKYI